MAVGDWGYGFGTGTIQDQNLGRYHGQRFGAVKTPAVTNKSSAVPMPTWNRTKRNPGLARETIRRNSSAEHNGSNDPDSVARRRAIIFMTNQQEA